MQMSNKRFKGQDAILLVIRNVSHVVRLEKMSSEVIYHKLINKTISSSQMAPVNAILNLSEILMNTAVASHLSKEDRDFYLQVIWSSGKMIQYNVQSQLS